MTEIIVLLAIFWVPIFIVLLKNLLWDLYYWEIKEYRWDRFWTQLRWDQSDGNRGYFRIYIKFILFSLATLIFTIPFLAFFSVISSFVIWAFQGIDFIKDILMSTYKRPSLKSPRNFLITILAFIFITVLIALISYPFIIIQRDFATEGIRNTDFVNNIFLKETDGNGYVIPDVAVLLAFSTLLGLFLDLAMPVILPFFVFATSPIAEIRRKIIIFKAKKKLSGLKKRPVFIGITGSQGKTTTKEMLYSILSQKYKVAKTPENYNTTVGIATAVLSSIKKDTEIFIAEIGAYKKGEIKNAVQNFQLDSAIITDIALQHVGLFGSPKKLAEAKFEITEGLESNALAVINADNDFSLGFSKQLQSKVVLTTSNKSNAEEVKSRDDLKTDVYYISNISDRENSLVFEFLDEDKELVKVKINSSKIHLAELGLQCFIIAKHYGMTNSEIIEAFKQINFPAKRLEFETGDNNLNILNDSYNSNAKGFNAAVDLLNKSAKNGKRIVVTKGIYELGSHKRKVYWELAENMKAKVDIVVTTDNMLMSVINEVAPTIQIIKTKDVDDMIYQIRTHSKPGDFILIEGRVHPKVIQSIVSERM